MDSTQTGAPRSVGQDPLGTYGSLLTWLVVIMASLGGLALVVGGAAVLLIVDEALVAEMVADGTVQFDPLTAAELNDVASTAFQWTGIGLVITGLVTVSAGIWFGLYRRRPVDSQSPILTVAVVGGVVTLVTSFVPFSMVLGGALAGYLRRGDRRAGTTAGAASGAVAFAPGALIMLSVFVGMVAGALSIGESAFAMFAVGLLLFGLLLSMAFSAGLAALGGFLGTLLREDGSGPAQDSEPV